jgi:hypothetical protein
MFPQRLRREQQLQTLQMGYMEMIQMMRSISAHLDRQADNQERVSKVVERFPEALDGLRSIGEATVQQGQMLGMVRDQMERSADNEEELLGSMNSFNKTLTVMDDTNRNTTQAIHTLVERARESESELRALMERSEKRMARLTGFMALLALAAVLFGLYAMFTSRTSPSAAPPPPPQSGSAPSPRSAAPAPGQTAPRASMSSPPPAAAPNRETPAPSIWVDEPEELSTLRLSASPAGPTRIHDDVRDTAGSERADPKVDPEPSRRRRGLVGVLKRIFSFYLDDDPAASSVDLSDETNAERQDS